MEQRSVAVAIVGSRAEADIVAGLLQSSGVPAYISADDAGGQEPQLQADGVRVLVAAADEDVAREVLVSVDDPPPAPPAPHPDRS